MSANNGAWIFDRRADLLVFGGSALLAFVLVAAGHLLGISSGDTPPGLWLAIVLGVDVSHVWSTGFRTYADPVELRRRPALYYSAPLAIWAIGVCIYICFGGASFWRLLAYTAPLPLRAATVWLDAPLSAARGGNRRGPYRYCRDLYVHTRSGALVACRARAKLSLVSPR